MTDQPRLPEGVKTLTTRVCAGCGRTVNGGGHHSHPDSEFKGLLCPYREVEVITLSDLPTIRDAAVEQFIKRLEGPTAKERAEEALQNVGLGEAIRAAIVAALGSGNKEAAHPDA